MMNDYNKSKDLAEARIQKLRELSLESGDIKLSHTIGAGGFSVVYIWQLSQQTSRYQGGEAQGWQQTQQDGKEGRRE